MRKEALFAGATILTVTHSLNPVKPRLGGNPEGNLGNWFGHGKNPDSGTEIDPEWDKIGEKEIGEILKGLGKIDTPAEFVAVFCVVAVVLGGIWWLNRNPSTVQI